ncbi:MAG: hypothetical protein HY923_06365 [Elusimicrobia bacterium]|nr:hypothetical protein [Elusimicrobiota bacterium]
MKINLAVAALLLAVSASAQVKWEKIEGQHSGIRERRAVAVTEKAAWEKMWREHNSAAPVPAVDFAAESVVAVFLGQTRSAGTKVDVVVQEDALDKSRLNVFYKEVRSGKNFAALIMCEPYAIVKVRKASKIAIETNGAVSIPEKAAAPVNPRDTTTVRMLLETLSGPSFDGSR